MKFLTLDDIKERGTVLVRVDINCPLNKETMEITDSERIKAAAKTIKELLDKGNAVVVLAHQGRPGDWDFTGLQNHAKKMSEILGQAVKFIPDIFGARALKEIKDLKPGEVLMLDNVRKYKDEMVEDTAGAHSKKVMVKKLSKFFVAYVNDAFSAIHRSQCSLVGFTKVLPSYAGRLMEAELTNCGKLVDGGAHSLFIFGGVKFGKTHKVVSSVLGRDSEVIVSGVTGWAFIKAAGVNLGGTEKSLEKEGTPEFFEVAGELVTKYKPLHLPVDGAYLQGDLRKEIDVTQLPIEQSLYDIGQKSIKEFKEIIVRAKTIFISGPAGMFEDPRFATGTVELLRAVAHSEAFKIIGGGHTAGMLRKLGLEEKVNFISTGGGALEELLIGKKLPVVAALEEAAQKGYMH